ncbi:alpha/beta hydrolase [Desulfuromonas sp. AOP6]|uniref:alpha/beta fold hydrolase n=1 Tax=Desulfuromonas sp. AOP6 TaxID=1566351 RepID=UPI0012722536|nr:alpha/beta hydrolase [Desulfuromonas sp. AOP6]BCA80347.1 alpha/beta hydrolase [Desulfuromonas sp. AOP6]
MADDGTRIIRQENGHIFGISEFGTPTGKPLFYFHGFPGSRLEARIIHQLAWRHQIRVIAVDRPGYGKSSYQPQRRLSHWSRDIGDIADALELDRFSILGVSGGAPYAAACARFMPDRLIKTGIVCGLAPLDEAALLKRLHGPDRRFVWMKKLPRPLYRLPLLLAGLAARRQPQHLLALVARTLPPCDRAAMTDEDIRPLLTDSMREAFSQGSAGAFADLCVYGESWGFALEDIRTKVLLWHGEKDTVVPCAMGRFMAERIAGCAATFLPEEGHFSLPLLQAEAILMALMDQDDLPTGYGNGTIRG